MVLTPQDFVSKWKRAEARERQSVQEHFLDLCALVGHETPMQQDPSGTRFAFEMGAAKTSGGSGWADVAKLGYFGWEYKGKDSDLDKAYEQLLRYRDALQNPPLLIVSDINHIVIRTNYTNLPTKTITLTLDDLLTAEGIKTLKTVFFNPEQLKPQETIESVTQEAARQFATLANVLRKFGEEPQAVAHFLIRLLFCLFAEDIGLLPEKLFPRLLTQTRHNSKDFAEVLRQLFRAMNTGGYFGSDRILHFNGGLFDDDHVLQLDSDAMDIIGKIDGLDWGAIKPSIFGTLFERGLDPAKRSQLGAHYTGEDDILLIVEPVLMAPLRKEWGELKVECLRLKEESEKWEGASGEWKVGSDKGEVGSRKGKKEAIRKRTSSLKGIGGKLRDFADKIASVKVLDPACGSANFLYVALRLLLDLQNEVLSFSDEMGAGRPYITVTPAQLYGIETNEYAYELAQMTIQIGYIQWLRDNGYGFPTEPILRQTKNILNMDAVLSLTPTPLPEGEGQGVRAQEPSWPAVDVIIGNPPFLGGNKIRAELGDEYVDALFKLYEGRVPAFADLVCYWFEKARAMIETGKAKRAGLLATNSIRGGVNRKVLERIKETGDIFWAQSDRDWILDGAAVRVSMVGFDDGRETTKSLDSFPAESINPDLSTQSDITKAKILAENLEIAYRGNQKGGPFDITYEEAQVMLRAPNPNGKPNSDVVKKWVNGMDLTQENKNMWLIDFGVDMPIERAAQYELPFEFVKRVVYPVRKDNNRKHYRERWWIHAEPRPGMRQAIKKLPRYIVTLHTSKHRIFLRLDNQTIPDHALVVFARSDDYFLGVLQSKIHTVWSLKLGTSLEDRPRYTPSTSFETFPFPWAPGQEPVDDPRVKSIAQAAKELVEQRERWLNTQTSEVSETSEVSRDKKRTLTNLYNQRPTWLDLAHRKLDEAVFAAYGWKSDITDEEILERLLSLNLERGK